jgi:hypothetical protein
MTKWQLSILLVALAFLAAGLLFFALFICFGFLLISSNSTHIGQGHEMATWAFLTYSFTAFSATGLLAFTLKSVMPNKLFMALLTPIIISGIFLAGIPLFQILSGAISNNA